MHGKDANLKMLRTIGARAFVHVETYTQKLAAKAWEGKLCGYSTDSRAYRVYNPTTKKVTDSRNVNRERRRTVFIFIYRAFMITRLR